MHYAYRRIIDDLNTPLQLVYLNMNTLTQLLKTEKNTEVIKNSYEFWKAEGKQHLFIDISIAHLNTTALKIILITEGPEIFQNAYSL